MDHPEYHIEIGNATHIGQIRKQNEDYLAHFETPLGYCVIVCDGMGGHPGGEIAAQTASTAIQKYLQDSQNCTSTVSDTLINAFEFANFQLKELIKHNAALNGMGTTCALALIQRGLLYTAHAGDSRIYLIREKKMGQITKDHSSVQQLVDEGILTKDQAENNINKNQILKAIGIFEMVSPSVSEEPLLLLKDDKLLVCTDGLTNNVNEELIAETIFSIKDVQSSSLALIDLANKNGGYDNITVQVIHYRGDKN